MSFRFNFPHSSESENSENIVELYKNECILDKSSKCITRCDFLSLFNKKLKVTDEDISLLKIQDIEVKYTLINSIEIITEDEVFSQINSLQTDIIPGKYEGGLKIWECCIDLANYITENNCIKDGDSVLELGCGAGIPGVIAYLQGASVTFQDFNQEVLEYFTLRNVLLNTAENKLCKIPEVCQFLYGDWEAISKKFYSDLNTREKFDVILTSETIYKKCNQRKLLEIMKNTLKPEGTIYLSAKIHYFGVGDGGGIIDFETLVHSDNTFEVVSVHRITEGIERQILKLKFKKITSLQDSV